MYAHILPECRKTEVVGTCAECYGQSALAALSCLVDENHPNSLQAYNWLKNDIDGKVKYIHVFPHSGLEGYPSFDIPRNDIIEGDGYNNAGAVVGAVIGSLFGVYCVIVLCGVVLVGVLFFLLRCKNRKDDEKGVELEDDV